MAELEQVWSEMHGALLAFLRRRVKDEHLAEDLLHETFLRIHDGLPSLAEEERLGAWTFRVARNVVAAHFRRPRAQGELDDSSLAEPECADGNLNREVEGWLRGMLAALPSEYREAVELAELQGLTSSEIAARLGLSVSGAKSRVQRGREQLGALLANCCHLEFDRRGNVVDYERRGSCRHCSDC
jgi:RNA polymerase sigma-70 factor (ECF subfamily)